ncbi:lipopolysaccharide biosynthesis protein, partial [bacterium]|nr:lipopolysaccharide biosynthesis protein [bacterium]
MSEINASLKKRIIRGFFWLSSLTFLGQIITWSVTLIVIRLLRPEDYGLMAMAAVYIGFLTLLNEVGLGAAIVQKAEIDEQELKKVSGVVIIINIVLFCLIIAAAPLLASFFSEPRLVPLLRVLGMNFILLSFYLVPESLLVRELEFRRKSLIDLIGNLLSSAIVLTLAFYGFGVWALVWGILGMNLFKAVAYNSKRNLRYWPTFSMRGIRRMLAFGGYVSVSRILWYFYSQADIIIAGRLFGKEILGIYSVAMHLVSLPLQKISPLLIQIGLPAFSRIQEDLQSMQSNFLKVLRLLNLITFPGFTGLAVIAP